MDYEHILKTTTGLPFVFKANAATCMQNGGHIYCLGWRTFEAFAAAEYNAKVANIVSYVSFREIRKAYKNNPNEKLHLTVDPIDESTIQVACMAINADVEIKIKGNIIRVKYAGDKFTSVSYADTAHWLLKQIIGEKKWTRVCAKFLRNYDKYAKVADTNPTNVVEYKCGSKVEPKQDTPKPKQEPDPKIKQLEETIRGLKLDLQRAQEEHANERAAIEKHKLERESAKKAAADAIKKRFAGQRASAVRAEVIECCREYYSSKINALAQVIIVELSEQSNDTLENLLCCVCYVAPKVILGLKCKHLSMCRGCFDEYKKKGNSGCPICRTDGEFIEVFTTC